MRISLVVLEKLYAVCGYDYPDESIDDFDRLLWEFNQKTVDGFVEISSFDELFFKGITETDKQKLIDEFKRNSTY